MTNRSEFLPERDPLLDAYNKVVMIAEMLIRQECNFCHSADDICDVCDGCISDELKEAIAKVKALTEKKA